MKTSLRYALTVSYIALILAVIAITFLITATLLPTSHVSKQIQQTQDIARDLTTLTESLEKNSQQDHNHLVEYATPQTINKIIEPTKTSLLYSKHHNTTHITLSIQGELINKSGFIITKSYEEGDFVLIEQEEDLKVGFYHHIDEDKGFIVPENGKGPSFEVEEKDIQGKIILRTIT